jgi:hypothetical protein
VRAVTLGYGAQVHLVTSAGSLCGQLSRQVAERAVEVLLDEVPDNARCQSFKQLDPRPMPFVRIPARAR